jgi:hypothetical protein
LARSVYCEAVNWVCPLRGVTSDVTPEISARTGFSRGVCRISTLIYFLLGIRPLPCPAKEDVKRIHTLIRTADGLPPFVGARRIRGSVFGRLPNIVR